MISNNRIKFIISLQTKKCRQAEGLFLAEGAKVVAEFLASDYQCVQLLCTEEFARKHESLIIASGAETDVVSPAILERAGTLQSNNAALAVVQSKPGTPFSPGPDEYILALDRIADPGNLGTLIRIADWYGIKRIVASPDTAEHTNPKVIAATMGSFTRIHIWYTDLPNFLSTQPLPVYGAFLNGANVHHEPFGPGGIILMGSESHGIGNEAAKFVTQRISIPAYGQAESLNAAIAAAVICDNVRRVRG
ncbi:MAG: RNA methyltransferase [Bacteroidota bacterium]